RGRLQRAGGDLGLGLEALEDGDLVAQLPEEFGLLVNDLQQPLHQGRLLRLSNDRDRYPHALYLYELSASSSPVLLRCDRQPWGRTGALRLARAPPTARSCPTPS